MKNAERRVLNVKVPLGLLLSAFCILHSSFAQEDAELPPPPKRPGVQITFIPPPLKGTLSLGIFNKAGKLVRTLHREAATKEFVVGLNGLITWWDGKDDAGAAAPKGNYSVRGYAVGAVEFQGEAFHFNDWIEDEKSPRIRRIISISNYGGNGFSSSPQFYAELSNGKKGYAEYSSENGKIHRFQSYESESAPQLTEEERLAEADGVKEVLMIDGKLYGLRAGQVVKRESEIWEKISLPSVENATYLVPMPQDGIGWWLIDNTPTGIVLKRFGADGSFIRSLAIAATEPQPIALCADANEMFLILLEEAAGLQRMRTLRRQEKIEATNGENVATPKISEWTVTMSKTIRVSDKLEDVQADLKTEAGEAFAGVEKINVRLQPNQLVQNKITNVDVGVAVDAKGSFLRTADGLPLKRITETPGLKWVAMMKESGGKGVTIFQSDGAVVEEFKAKKLASMMAFDAGDYEWAGR